MVVVCLVLASVRHSGLAAPPADGPSAPPRLEITLDPAAADTAVDGRLYLFLSQRAGEPMRGPDWFNPEPFFRLDVKRFEPGHSVIMDDQAAGFPDVLSTVPAGKYRAQAVFDHDFYEPAPANGVGNAYSEVVEIDLSPAGADSDDDGPLKIRLTKRVPNRPFPDSESVKEVVLRSDCLARFHGHEMLERAAVVLPPSYDEDRERRYPAVYIVPGFGGSHRDALRFQRFGLGGSKDGGAEFIQVFLSGRCKWGHHAYADSATNGPRGEALVREMIPLIDRQFRTIAQPTARFVMGHSSGGWSSLWLQVTYPETFGGVWASSPDPVDFRDFQRIDLYADPPQNVYRDSQGNRRPIARRGDKPVLWFDDFTKMDDVLERGGQLRSFEAVFSPLDSGGLPRRTWNRQSGEVNLNVAKAWQRYDISLILKRDWNRLKPLLTGKLHVTMGTLDTFYLDGATRLLADRLKELNSDAQIELVEGANHGSVLTPDYFARIRKEMSDAFGKSHPDLLPTSAGTR
jgi:pimeloyl-ACP methyl ester carboxylesterase